VSAERRAIDYAIVHTTEYDYVHPVLVSHHVARLSPRQMDHQICHEHEILIDPGAVGVERHRDYYGNAMLFFATQSSHRRLTVTARSRVTLDLPALPESSHSPPWEEAAAHHALPLEALDCAVEVGGVRDGGEAAAYGRASFPPGRPLLEALTDLTGRIHRDFTYDPQATTVSTTLAEVLATRRGVCQDFARVEIACLRALGIPARYVSGYLETLPPPGLPRLVGADASHAWVSVYCPRHGWIDVDPTNNLVPARAHITLAWGRDFADVSPIRGVILGGGDHSLRVAVDVTRV